MRMTIAAAVALWAAQASAAVPLVFSHHGRLLDASDAPVNATLTLTVRFYKRPVDADEIERVQNLLAERTYANVQVTGGSYSILIGDPALGEAIDAAIFAQDVWMAVKIGDEAEMAPRMRVGSVPWALRAGNADALGDLAPAAFAKWSDLPWDKNDSQRTFAAAVEGALDGATFDAQEVSAESVCIGGDCRTEWPSEGVWTEVSGGISYTGGVDVTGTVRATAFEGSGAALTGVTAASVPWTGVTDKPAEFAPAAGSAYYLSSSGGNVSGDLGVTGNAGIGTTNPDARLTVAGGNIMLDNAKALIGRRAAGGSGNIIGTDASNNLLIGESSWPNVLISGNVGVGTISPAARLDVGGTGAIKIPVGTTAERPASGVAGMLRYNATLGAIEFHNGSAWQPLVAQFIATGGTVTEAGGYRIHTFNSTGTFTVSAAKNVEVLVVAGGGSGGWGNTNEGGGGGGGGGLCYKATHALTGGTVYAVTVGGGGTAPTSGVKGGNGGNSSFDGITALGGGAGGSCGSEDGASGGSGGGGQGCGSDHGGGSATQGNSGGATCYGNAGGSGRWVGNAPGNGNGGGGGGAGGAGSNGQSRSNQTSGGAGPGRAYSLSGSSVTYSTGGNGGPGQSSANGSDASPANSGNGGHGGNVSGGAGASGVVIIRYAL